MSIFRKRCLLASKFLFASLLLTTGFAGKASAEFVPAPWPETEPKIVSATFARAGITVRDIDESLKFFRDVMGMAVLVDRKAMFDPRLPAFSGLQEGQTIRLTILRNETEGSTKFNAGYIALSEISDTEGNRLPPLENVASTGSEPGSIMIQFLVDDVHDIHRQVVDLGYEIISAPVVRPDDTNSELLVRDVNGIRYWITDRYTRTIFLHEKPED